MDWMPFTVAAPVGAALRDDVVTYGPDIPTEDDLKLLGDVAGKRVLEVGCGAGRNTVALARRGARVIAVDDDAEQLAVARAAAEAAEIKVEWHHAPLSQLAFLRADTVDAAICVGALVHVEDISRLFRQVHRVLRTGQHLVLSVPHPTFALLDPGSADPTRIVHSAFDEQPYGFADPRSGWRNRNMSTISTHLFRAGFSIDTVLEPQAEGAGPRSPSWSPAMANVPATLIVRARKEGI